MRLLGTIMAWVGGIVGITNLIAGNPHTWIIFFWGAVCIVGIIIRTKHPSEKKDEK